MGWKMSRSGRGSVIAYSDFNGPDEKCFIISTTHPWEVNEWNPTTDPAAAFQVLEKCRERMSGKGTICIETTDDGQAAIFIIRNDFANIPTLHPSLPTAIALFAKQMRGK